MKKRLFVVMSALVILHFMLIGNALSQSDDNKAFDGYTIFTTLMSTTTNLINMDGDVVHTWEHDSASSFSTYFLNNGNIYRAAARSSAGGPGASGPGGSGPGGGMRRGGMPGFGDPNAFGGFRGMPGGGAPRGGAPGGGTPGGGGVGAGGLIQEVDWDGNLIWNFEYYTEKEIPHHDIERMPNGNVLIICWDEKTEEENLAAGRNPEYQTAALPPDCIVEVKSTGKTTGEVVWKWYAWDHLVQEFDKDKPNYGKVSEHPELIDINYSESWADAPAGGNSAGGGMTIVPGERIPTTDWIHFNAVAYNEELDLIAVSSYTFSEIWIIDHSTTMEEAKGHTGGKHGKGGDLLYRYGNPAAYQHGTNDDQKLFCQHDIHWIAKGLPGEGNMLVFNNGPNRQDGKYSSVEEFILPVDDKGKFKMDGKKFADVKPVWTYIDPEDKTNFYATNISGAQRLPNGNTFICNGPNGHLFEVTPDKETVWDYKYTSGSSGNTINGIDVGNLIFRAYRIPADHPGLKGKNLKLRK